LSGITEIVRLLKFTVPPVARYWRVNVFEPGVRFVISTGLPLVTVTEFDDTDRASEAAWVVAPETAKLINPESPNAGESVADTVT
jgi:hypothetical protein